MHGINTTDYTYFQKLLKRRLPETHEIEILGNVDNLPILFVQPKDQHYNKNILIVAGFHGEERAPCWGILLWLHRLNLIKANITIIPIVNVDGFSRGTRYNQWKEVSNRGFLDTSPDLSSESKILWKYKDKLISAAKDGFLTLHENNERCGYYFYLLAEKVMPELNEAFKQAVCPPLTILPDGNYYHPDEGHYVIENACVFNNIDDSLESYLKSKGSPICVTSETPILSTDFNYRVAVTPRIIDTFITHILK